ncbi:MAG: ribosome maturation factor [Bacteroidota bacterium]
MIEQKIEALLADKFQEEAYADFFIVEVKLNATNNKLEVFVDSDTSLPLSKCQKISRYLEGHIDENQWLGEKYIIEVSSPGISRPLTLVRQYKKNIGRKIAIKFLEQGVKKREGTLVDANETACFIEEKVVRKEGKKKIRTTEVSEIPYNTISKAVIKPAFR